MFKCLYKSWQFLFLRNLNIRRTVISTNQSTVCVVNMANNAHKLTLLTFGIFQCSSTCDSGIQRRLVVCEDRHSERVEESKCSIATRPPEQQSCNSGPCPQWNYGNWGSVRFVTFVAFVYCADVHLTSKADVSVMLI